MRRKLRPQCPARFIPVRESTESLPQPHESDIPFTIHAVLFDLDRALIKHYTQRPPLRLNRKQEDCRDYDDGDVAKFHDHSIVFIWMSLRGVSVASGDASDDRW